MRQVVLIIFVTLAGWVGAAPLSYAGAFEVLSCAAAPDNSNRAWIGTTNTTSHLTFETVCPPGADTHGGLGARDILGAPSAPDGSQAEWTFTAPLGTTITRWRYERYLGKYSDDNWAVYGKLGDGTIFDTCSIPITGDRCSVGGAGMGQSGTFRDLAGISTDRLIFGFRCQGGGGSCATGATIQRVWASIYSSTVTLTENTPPTVGAPSGALVTGGGWHQGTEDVEFTASDGSPGVGIKETRVYVDGVQRSSATQSCDYTFTVPCPNPVGTVTHSVDTTAITDGQRQVQVAAIDTADNERLGAPVTVRVDNNSPSALTIAGNVSGSQIAVTWGANDGAGSGVQSYDLEVSQDGGAFTPWLTGTTQTSAVHEGSPGSSYVFRMRARDGAGHTSAFVSSGQVVASAPPADGGTAPSPGGELPAPSASGGTPMPGSGDPGPAARPRSTPALMIRSARRSGGRLAVVGALPRAATGEVIVTYRARAGGRIRGIQRMVEVVEGRFRTLLTFPRLLRHPHRAVVTVRYSGDARYRPRTVRAVVTR